MKFPYKKCTTNMKFGFCRGTNVVTLAGQTIKFPADFHSYKHSAGARMRKKQGALWPHKSPDQTIDSEPVSLWGRLAAFRPKIAPKKQGRSNFTSISCLFAPHEIWVSLLQLRRRETNLPCSNFPLMRKSALSLFPNTAFLVVL